MGLLATRMAERRAALTYQQIWGGDLLTGRSNTSAGVAVTMESAVTLSAVFACVRLLADSVSTLPVGVFVRDRGVMRPSGPRPVWLDTPSAADPSITRIGYFSQVMMSLLLDGNAFIGLQYDDFARVSEVTVLDPRRVTITSDERGAPVYSVRNGAGVAREYDATDVLHIPLLRMPGSMRGLSPIEAARQSIGLGKVAEQYGAEFFANGASMAGVLKTKAELSQDEAEQLGEKFDRKHSGSGRRHKTGVLTGGAEFQQLSVTPEQAQFLELRRFQTVDIARIYRIAPHLIQDVSPGSVSYNSVEAQGIEFATLAVRPYLELIEAAHSRPGMLETGQFINFDEAGLQRGDLKGRFEAYATGINAGFLVRADARKAEALAPVDGLDVPLVPLNLGSADVVDINQRVVALGALVRSGFEPGPAAKAVGLPPIAHTGLVPVTVQGDQVALGQTVPAPTNGAQP